jgi:hypothetical protein
MSGMRALTALVVATLVSTACGSEANAPTAASGPSGPTTTTSVSTAPAPEYTVTMTQIRGESFDELGSWTSDFGVLEGGDPAVVEAFNHASRTAVLDQIDEAVKATSEGTTPWTFEATGQVSFRPIAVAQIIYGSLGFGAHPTAYISTVVIDTRSTDPIMITDLFVDPQAGLDRLAEQTRTMLAADGLEVGPGEPGIAPKGENFANWIPAGEGLELHFNEYQFGPRQPAVVTVPWTALTGMIAPVMADIAT